VVGGGVPIDSLGHGEAVWHTDISYQAARRNLIIVGMVGAFVFLVPVVLTHDLTTVALCLSLPFCASLALLLVGAGLSFFMHPEKPFQAGEPR
jgi:uncharacterized membrane protein